MIRNSIILMLFVLLSSSFVKDGQNKLYSNYISAFENLGTVQFYLVVKVTNMNNGLNREYCTTGNFFSGALHKEFDLGYDSIGSSKVDSIARNNFDRFFEFKSEKAIRNISGVNGYTMADLAELNEKVDFDSLAKRILRSGKWNKRIESSSTRIMYAHALFNRGILTGTNTCWGGSIFYVNSEYIENQFINMAPRK